MLADDVFDNTAAVAMRATLLKISIELVADTALAVAVSCRRTFTTAVS